MAIDKRLVTPEMFARFYLGLDLYVWQIEALHAVWMREKVAVRAANGSGKTARLVAPALLWFLWRYPKGRAIVTSGSWNQIATQLFYNLHLYKHLPIFHGWTFNNDCISTPQGGFIRGLSTNNPGRAEGYHENISDPEREHLFLKEYLKLIRKSTKEYNLEQEDEESPVMYIVDEAKTVPDPIFTAIDRCTITYRLYCSSPGGTFGQFYRCFTSEADAFVKIVVRSATLRKDGTVDYEATDCPHIKRSKIEDIVNRYGVDSPFTQSTIFANFMEADGLLVISESELLYAMENPPERTEGTVFGAMDFAAGGDETTTSICSGNYARCIQAFRSKDTVQSRKRQIQALTDAGVVEGNAIGDADGLGKPIVQQMQAEGYWVEEFHGGRPCKDAESDNYANTISEAWCITGQLIKKGLLDVSDMDKGLQGSGTLFKQLTNRPLEIVTGGKVRVMPKKDMKKKLNLTSPDRADSFCMAVWLAYKMGGFLDLDEPTVTGGAKYDLNSHLFTEDTEEDFALL